MRNTTKSSLMKSFHDLAITKRVDSITVQDVCNAVHVNRQTFYYYFQDIFTLIKDNFNLEYLPIFRYVDDQEEYLRALRFALRKAVDDKAYIYAVLQSLYGKRTMDFFEDALGRIMEGFVVTSGQDMRLSPQQIHLVAQYHTYAILGILQDWFLHDVEVSVDIIIFRIETIMNHSIINALRRFERSNSLTIN